MKLFYLFKITCWFHLVFGEEYNLSGDPGQGYSLDINIGDPKQMLRVIVDTGSTSLAIASYARPDSDEYFHTGNSTTFVDTGEEVQSTFLKGSMVGHHVTDLIEIPSLKHELNALEVQTDFVIITKSHNFFVNESKWQGLLGLAYWPVGASGEHLIVGSWLDSLENHLDKNVSFELELCGVQSTMNATHYGKFSVIVNDNLTDYTPTFRTPILQQRWYEVGVLGINIRYPNATINDSNKLKQSIILDKPSVDTCQKLNKQKSVLDSGTTSITLTNDVYGELVQILRQEAEASNLSLNNEFWSFSETACFPEPQEWLTMPIIEINLLSDVVDNQYFNLEIPPQNYIRTMAAGNSSDKDGSVSQFCYMLGLEPSSDDVIVLGYTAMEGLKVLFNRSGGWIGFETSDCGPNARISGPYTVPFSFMDACYLTQSDSEVPASIQVAQWSLCALSIIAEIMLICLLAPAAKKYILRRQRAAHAFSRDACTDQELT